MNITYKNGKTYELKYTYRAMMLFENISNKSFNTKTMTDFVAFLYCLILSQEREDNIDFNEFVDWLDDNNDIFNDYVKWLVNIYTEQANKIADKVDIKKPEDDIKEVKSDSKN